MYKKPDVDRKDGPAIYFDTKRFHYVATFNLPFAYKKEAPSQKKQSSGMQTIYEKANCCIYMVLQPVGQDDRVYIVANTHLNFNSNRGDIKLAEIKLLTDGLASLKSYY